MNEDNKSMEEIISISYFDTDNMDIKNHVDRYFEIKRDIINVLNKYNVMWVLTDTNGFNNKDKEIERLNNIINELEKEIDRLLERQYESERFAKEQGFDTYLPAKENLLCIKNKLQKLKGSDK